MKIVLLMTGWALVTLGFIGAFLPVMPTTIFLILALPCFARSSPRFEAWLLNHPWFGPQLRSWKESGAISRRSKFIAVGTIWPSIIVSCFFTPAWAQIVLITVGIGITLYLLSRPVS